MKTLPHLADTHSMHLSSSSALWLLARVCINIVNTVNTRQKPAKHFFAHVKQANAQRSCLHSNTQHKPTHPATSSQSFGDRAKGFARARRALARKCHAWTVCVDFVAWSAGTHGIHTLCPRFYADCGYGIFFTSHGFNGFSQNPREKMLAYIHPHYQYNYI